ncbi:hypothetical protein [Pandoraea sputorum]|uniref:hypothetical protein n=1 Tax=Pandoraea sputorum TaxID=93222 RepID=UPI002B2EA882|nr:hypothetical protein THI4931_46550 [Pandoraea sputorum]
MPGVVSVLAGVAATALLADCAELSDLIDLIDLIDARAVAGVALSAREASAGVAFAPGGSRLTRWAIEGMATCRFND